MSPPAAHPQSHTLGCSTGSEERIDKVIRAAHKALAESGVQMSPRRVNKIVRRFAMNARKHGVSFHEYLSVEANLSPAQRRSIEANPDLQRVTAYRDKTGEDAVNNVMRRAKTNKMDTPPCSTPTRAPRISVEDLVPDPSEVEDILAMANVSDEQFEVVLAEARSEGDMSRANVVRKCRAKVQ